MFGCKYVYEYFWQVFVYFLLCATSVGPNSDVEKKKY